MDVREILFRGIDEGTNEWVCGYYYESQKPSDFGGERRYYIFDDKTISKYNVLPNTVGQYTGLTDKNGKKIFEGDIVDCWSEGVNAQGTVQQRRDGLWIIYPAWQKHIMWGLCPDEYSYTTVEVIGNIYDNPELIKT